jgi:hypothetical protein
MTEARIAVFVFKFQLKKSKVGLVDLRPEYWATIYRDQNAECFTMLILHTSAKTTQTFKVGGGFVPRSPISDLSDLNFNLGEFSPSMHAEATALGIQSPGTASLDLEPRKFDVTVPALTHATADCYVISWHSFAAKVGKVNIVVGL